MPFGYDPATQLVTTQRQAFRRENTTLSNITNVDLDFATGSLKHRMAVGFELSREESEAGRFPNNIPGNPGTVSIFGPDPRRPMPPFTGLVPTQTANVKIDTVAAYAFDTIEIDPRWQVTGGLRLERYEVRIESRTAAGAPQGPDGFERSEVSLGGRVGLVYKPAANGSIYVAVSESALPPGSFLSNPDISRTGDNALPGWEGQNHPDSREQRATNFEIGTKWDLFDRRLSTTAAYFHTERRNIAMGPGVEPVGYGRHRVHGIELGGAGSITRDWSMFGGLLLMDSKRTHSAAVDAALSGDYGTYTTTIGDQLAFTPRISANLWHGRFGKLPSFTVVNLMASYAVNRNLSVRLNIDNVFDKLYATSANWPGTRVFLGPPRSFMVSADLAF